MALGPAVVIALSAGADPAVSANMNEWINTIQSLQLPFALIPMLHFTNSTRVMGVFANKSWKKVLYWIIATALISLNLYFVLDFAFVDDSSPIPKTTGMGIVVVVYMSVYLFFVGSMIRDEVMSVVHWALGTEKPKPAKPSVGISGGEAALLGEDEERGENSAGKGSDPLDAAFEAQQ